VDTIIDTEDLQRIIEKGVWFAEWNKDYNNYIIENISNNIDERKHPEKIALHSFILGSHPKAPIRHLNGDTLDNRKSNIEIYNQNTINDYRLINDNTIAVILRDKYGKENATTLIDKEDLDRVVNTDYTWVLYILKKEPYAVANTPEGRVFLNRFIMNTPDDTITHPINLNTLDNRKINLENKIIEEE
jgi:hypothetical protein